MKMKLIGGVVLALTIAGCDDTTDNIGIYTDSDNIEASYTVFDAYTRSIVADSVLSKSSSCYVGCLTDPETRTQVKADFLTQFITLDDFIFPDYELLHKNEEGKVIADSAEIEVVFSDFYGDLNNPMKIEAYELDTTNAIREDTTYYSNMDLSQFINSKRPEAIASRVIAAKDMSDSEDSYQTIRFSLPKSYGTDIMQKYFEHKEFFKNPYNFIRHVCPGFYFTYSDGNELMLNCTITQLNVYFKYWDEELKKDTIGYTGFPATPEVLQYSSFSNDDLQPLADEKDWTYIKTPAGIFTEMSLPIDDIYKGHTEDSISQAQVVLYRYNAQYPESNMGVPQNLLMVRKNDLYSFFEEKKISDDKTSYVTSLNTSYNTYTFSNIGNLIAYCRKEQNEKAAAANISPEAWAAQNPDWNKVILVPVEVTTDDNNNVTRITNDMSLSSTRLYGGENAPIKIQVIYSSFKK